MDDRTWKLVKRVRSGDQVEGTELTNWAVEQPASGVEHSPALMELASLDGADSGASLSLFRQAVTELGYADLDAEIVINRLLDELLSALPELRADVRRDRQSGLDPYETDLKLAPRFLALFDTWTRGLKVVAELGSTYSEREDVDELTWSLEHAAHVVSEEEMGEYKFGWPWEKTIDEWTAALQSLASERA